MAAQQALPGNRLYFLDNLKTFLRLKVKWPLTFTSYSLFRSQFPLYHLHSESNMFKSCFSLSNSKTYYTIRFQEIHQF